MSYTLGMSMGQTITNWGVDLNPDIVAAGFKAIIRGEKPLLNETESKESMAAFNTERQAKMTAKRAEMIARQAEAAKEAGGKNKAVVKEFSGISPDSKGNILVKLQSGSANKPEINGIEILN